MGFLNQQLEKVAKEMDTPLVLSRDFPTTLSPERAKREASKLSNKVEWLRKDSLIPIGDTAPSYERFGPRRHSTGDIKRYMMDDSIWPYDSHDIKKLYDAARAVAISEYNQNWRNSAKLFRRPPADALKPYAAIADNKILKAKRLQYKDEDDKLRGKKLLFPELSDTAVARDEASDFATRYKALNDLSNIARLLQLGHPLNTDILNSLYPASSSLWHSR